MRARHIAAIAWASLTLLLAPLSAGDVPLSHYRQVEIAPTKTSIYIGTVSMTLPVFARSGQTYSSTYSAKVFPYFFYNERGQIAIDVPDADLLRLQHGERVEFKGRGISSDGEERRIEGHATPTDALTGKIKVRVFVSKKIQLIFNTTYRFRER